MPHATAGCDADIRPASEKPGAVQWPRILRLSFQQCCSRNPQLWSELRPPDANVLELHVHGVDQKASGSCVVVKSLVSHNAVATAAHCLDAMDVGGSIQRISKTYQRHRFVVQEPSAGTDYNCLLAVGGGSATVAESARDVAIVYFRNPSEGPNGSYLREVVRDQGLDLAPVPPAPPSRCRIVGFDCGVQHQSSAAMLGVKHGALVREFAVRQGCSGGAWLDGKHKLFAITSGGVGFDSCQCALDDFKVASVGAPFNADTVSTMLGLP
jgi:hypothetical protein